MNFSIAIIRKTLIYFANQIDDFAVIKGFFRTIVKTRSTDTKQLALLNYAQSMLW